MKRGSAGLFGRFFLVLIAGCWGAAAAPPDADLPKLEAAKNLGLAYLEEGKPADALEQFRQVQKLAPGEALGWADAAVAEIRMNDLPGAAKDLVEAWKRDPNDGAIDALEGKRQELAGRYAEAVKAYENAFRKSPDDLESRWAAARLDLDRVSGAAARGREILEDLVHRAPNNAFLLLRLAGAQLKGGDAPGALATYQKLSDLLWDADEKTHRFLGEGLAALQAGDTKTADLKFRIVENLLRVTPRYQQALHQVDMGVVGMPIETWSSALAARVRSRSEQGVPVRWVDVTSAVGLERLKDLRFSAVALGGADGLDIYLGGPSGIGHLPWKDGKAQALQPVAKDAAAAIAVADFGNSGAFEVATGAQIFGGPRVVALPGGDPHAAPIAIDFDNDGDLDLYVCSAGGDHLLRNNLDGTWADVTARAGLPPRFASRAGVARDFDRDGDMDLALATASGGLALLTNEREGRFLPAANSGLPSAGSFVALAAGDLDNDGTSSIVAASSGEITVFHNDGAGHFSGIGSLSLPEFGIRAVRLFDFDNDGFLDVAAVGARGMALYRNEGHFHFRRVDVPALPAASDLAAFDADGDGDLDLFVVLEQGGARLLRNDGGNANAWFDVTLQGLPTGSSKVNRFGYGSTLEIKAGTLYELRTVDSPVTHFGLGFRREADVLRVVWTNGVPQNEIEPKVRRRIIEAQLLKGSCPFLYARDSQGHWNFITDVLGRSPLGLRYDGVHLAVPDTLEWLIVRGDRLGPDASGTLALDYTEELWETLYLDLVELRAVDHPAGTEVVPNEKMTPPPFEPKRLYTIGRPLTPRALDGAGRDVTAKIAHQDGIFLSGFKPTRYQGIVASHALSLELPEARHARRVMLYLTGWIFYTDTSINVSMAQNSRFRSEPPVLEVPDGRGGWRVAIQNMGYPAGKTKTMAVDLSDVLDRKDPRVRIRTNLAIYWDRIAYTADDPEVPVEVRAIPMRSAVLSFRGFSRRVREAPDGPEIFVHDEVDRSPHWADMRGLYTRYGGVAELLDRVDDRYVVMRGGDAVRLLFDSRMLPPVPPGWQRDYLLVSDGWDKDADKNTLAGATVGPLPFHAETTYPYGPGEHYPDDEAHRAFIRDTLTRSGGPEEFLDAIRDGRWRSDAPPSSRAPAETMR
jgi:tetratricopeptide (TPR) repeat protein